MPIMGPPRFNRLPGTIAPLLTAGGTTIRMSTGPGGVTPPSSLPKTWAALVVTLNLGKVVIVGHSYGALTTDDPGAAAVSGRGGGGLHQRALRPTAAGSGGFE